MHDLPVEFANRLSGPKRLILGLVGVGVLVWPIWDLWPGIASVSLLSPVFWLIALGAAVTGGLFLAAAIFGRSTVLIVSSDGLELVEENLLRQWRVILPPDEVGPVTVIEQAWTDGPSTWRVSLARQGAKPLLSEDFQSATEGQALAGRLESALRHAGYLGPVRPPRQDDRA